MMLKSLFLVGLLLGILLNYSVTAALDTPTTHEATESNVGIKGYGGGYRWHRGGYGRGWGHGGYHHHHHHGGYHHHHGGRRGGWGGGCRWPGCGGAAQAVSNLDTMKNDP